MSQTALSGQSSQAELFIDRQINKTGIHVLAMDVLAGVMILIGGLLAALFVVALIDAWVIEFNVFFRVVALSVIVVGAIGFVCWYFWPLVYRRINPAYAARMIEEGRGGLRNSLINYLSIKQTGETTASKVVLSEIEMQAAKHLSEFPVESTIDRTQIIRLGIVLTVLVALFGGYKLLSPKDPFQSVARVFAPTAKISRPARVQISHVEPGDTEIVFGGVLPVTATITGSFAHPAELVFSTRDGQAVSRRLPMSPAEGQHKFTVNLTTSETGILQDLVYFIQAGDGRSPTYRVNVKSTPTMTVREVTLEPPSYTEIPVSTIVGQGEIEAYEGTRVTLTANTNVPIQSANIELLDERSLDASGQQRPIERIMMQANGQSATGSFVLQFNADGSPRMTHYRLNFRDEQGRLAEGTARYPVRIIPDLPPQIVIGQPGEDQVRLPVDGQLRVAIRANDQDFKVARIQFRLDHRGQSKVNQSLELQQLPDGQVAAQYTIVPKLLGLNVGDQILFYATAFDNKVSILTGQPDPNFDTSRTITLEVTAAENRGTDEADNRDQQLQDDSTSSNDGDKQDATNESGDDEQDSSQRSSEGANQSSGSEGTKDGDSQNEKAQSADAQQQSDPASETGNADGQSKSTESETEEPGGEGESTQRSRTGEDSKQENEPGTSSSADQSKGASESDAESTGQGNRSQPDQSSSTGGSDQSPRADSSESAGEPSSDSSSRTDSSSSSGSNPAANDGGPQSQSLDGEVSPDDGQGGRNQPLDRDAHAGERFERLLDKLNEREQQQAENASETSGNSEANPQSQDRGQSDDSSTGTGSPTDPRDAQSPSDGGSGTSQDQTKQEGEKGQSTPSQSPASNNTGIEDEKGSQSSQADGGDSGSLGNEDRPDQSGDSSGSENSGAAKQPQEEPQDSPGGGNANDPQRAEQKRTSGGGEEQQSGSPQNRDDAEKSGGALKSENDAKGTGQGDDSQNSGGKNSSTEANAGSKESTDSPSAPGTDSLSGSPSDTSESNPSQPGTEKSSAQSAENAQSTPNQQDGSETTGDPDRQPDESGATTQSNNNQKKGGSNEGSGQTELSKSDSAESTRNSSGADSSNSSSPESEQASNPEGTDSRSTGAAGSGGTGSRDDREPHTPTNIGQPTPADKANLEYADKATDLVLDYLENQQINPDPKLLEEMNWTADEMREFVRRWKEMKEKARAGSARDREQLTDSLQSLGLRPPTTQRNEFSRELDTQRGFEEDAAVNRPPAEMIPAFKAFQKGRSRVKK